MPKGCTLLRTRLDLKACRGEGEGGRSEGRGGGRGKGGGGRSEGRGGGRGEGRLRGGTWRIRVSTRVNGNLGNSGEAKGILRISRTPLKNLRNSFKKTINFFRMLRIHFRNQRIPFGNSQDSLKKSKDSSLEFQGFPLEVKDKSKDLS